MLRPLFFLIIFLLLAACQKPGNNAAQNDSTKDTSAIEVTPTAAAAPKQIPTPKGWSNPKNFIPDAVFDLRYATTNNFVGEQLYPCPTCWLRPAASEALIVVADELRANGYRIILFDCYRPLPIQERLWAIKPDATYVTPPSKGSMHNRGLAVDIGLADMDGNELDMGTPFDFFGRRAHQDFYDLDSTILDRRTLLKETMVNNGFGPIRSEWWHYSYRNSSAELSREQWPCPEAVK